MLYRSGVLLLCLVLAACNYNTRGSGSYGDDRYADIDAYGSEFSPDPAADTGKTPSTDDKTATCVPGKGPGERLESPVLEVSDKSPVLGVAIQAPERMLLKTATDVREWDLREGRQRLIRALDEADAATPFQEHASWPGSELDLRVNQAQGSIDVVQDGTVVTRIWLTGSGWAAVHESGRFDGDMSAWPNLSWRDSNTRLNFRQLVDLYFEPALLGRLAAGVGFATVEAPDIRGGLEMPPSAKLVVQRRADRAFGEVRVTDRGGCIGAVRVYLDGKGIPVEPPAERAGAAGQEVWRFEVPVPPGQSELTALATSPAKIEGQPDHLALVAPAEPVSDLPPTLHVLVVGIDRYASPALALNFARIDAQAIANWAGGLGAPFERVSVTELYDTQATRDRIREALVRLQNVPARDTVLVYLAGHGENDGVRWFFLPTEFGKEITVEAVTREGLSSKTLRDEILRIPARNVALILDACKSGDMRRAFSAATDERYLEWVGRTAGVRVLAATDQEQLAVELEALGHGALTYVLLKGLESRADQLPVDANITVQELYGYVDLILPKLTRRLAAHAQIPVIFEYGPDFPLRELNR